MDFFLGGGGGWGGGEGGSLRNRTVSFFFSFFFFFFFWGGGGVGDVISIHYMALRSRFRMGIFIWTANFQIFLGIPDIPDFFFFFFFFWGGGMGVNSRCWVQAYV